MDHKNRTLALLGLALALIAAGLAMGQPSQVMVKAVKICLECVGIG